MEIKIMGTPKELFQYELLKMNHADLNSEELSDNDEIKKILSGYAPLKPSGKDYLYNQLSELLEGKR